MGFSKDSKVCIVGTGKVGMSIVQAFAQKGFEIRGADVSEDNIKGGLERVTANLSKLVL